MLNISITDKHIDLAKFRELRRLGQVEVHWLRFMTSEEDLAVHVEACAKARGYKVVYPYHLCEIEVLFIECTPPQLHEVETAAKSRLKEVAEEKRRATDKKQDRVLAIA